MNNYYFRRGAMRGASHGLAIGTILGAIMIGIGRDWVMGALMLVGLINGVLLMLYRARLDNEIVIRVVDALSDRTE